MKEGKTMVEKILSEKVGREVHAGEIVVVDVDLVFAHDGTMPLAIEMMKELGKTEVFDKDKVIGICDHAFPSPSEKVSNVHSMMRKFSRANNIKFYENGEGISHQIILERFSAPYKVIIGADSHSTTHGALGAFATGMGSTDVATIMAYGRTWLRVPESFKLEIVGDLPEHVYSKDVFLHFVGEVGEEGLNYMSVEFLGDGIDRMSVESRITLSNMCVEAGAKNGLCRADEKVRNFLMEYGRENEYKELKPDENAYYKDEITIEAKELRPMIACPHKVSNVKPASECEGIEIDVVCIGSCTNGRIEDLRVAAKVLRGKKVKDAVRLFICPASRNVMLKAMKENLIEIFLEAGAVIIPPSCSFCIGRTFALADGEVALSTQNRNFKGRMGNNNAEIYLSSVETAAVSAIHGRIVDPSDVPR